MKTLVIMRGWPGSSKSTFVKDNLKTFVPLSADDYFIKDGVYQYDREKIGEAHKQCMRRFIDVLTGGPNLHDIVIDNTNIRVMEYIAYIKVAEALGYKCYQKVMTGSFQNVHGVPDSKVERMKKDFQEDKFLEHLPDNF